MKECQNFALFARQIYLNQKALINIHDFLHSKSTYRCWSIAATQCITCGIVATTNLHLGINCSELVKPGDSPNNIFCTTTFSNTYIRLKNKLRKDYSLCYNPDLEYFINHKIFVKLKLQFSIINEMMIKYVPAVILPCMLLWSPAAFWRKMIKIRDRIMYNVFFIYSIL